MSRSRGRQRRDLDAVDERAVGRHPPALQHAVLAALEFPPVRRVEPSLVAEIAGAGPHAELAAVDRDRDVGRPVRRSAGRLGRQFQREFERRDRLADQTGIVGKLILDEAAREPHQARIHAVRIEEGPGHVEQPDDSLRASTGRTARSLRSWYRGRSASRPRWRWRRRRSSRRGTSPAPRRRRRSRASDCLSAPSGSPCE